MLDYLTLAKTFPFKIHKLNIIHIPSVNVSMSICPSYIASLISYRILNGCVLEILLHVDVNIFVI